MGSIKTSIRTLMCSFQLSPTGPHCKMVEELLTSFVYLMSNAGFTAKLINAKQGIFFENGHWPQLVAKTCFVTSPTPFTVFDLNAQTYCWGYPS